MKKCLDLQLKCWFIRNVQALSENSETEKFEKYFICMHKSETLYLLFARVVSGRATSTMSVFAVGRWLSSETSPAKGDGTPFGIVFRSGQSSDTKESSKNISNVKIFFGRTFDDTAPVGAKQWDEFAFAWVDWKVNARAA